MRSFEFPVEAGHIHEFKRAVGDYDAPFDPDAAAPPTFMVAADRHDPEYDRRLRSDQPWPPVAPETGSGFHAGMVFEYHRHPEGWRSAHCHSGRWRGVDQTGTPRR